MTLCDICGGDNDVKLCDFCEAYLCKPCRWNPPKRLRAFIRKKLGYSF